MSKVVNLQTKKATTKLIFLEIIEQNFAVSVYWFDIGTLCFQFQTTILLCSELRIFFEPQIQYHLGE